MRGVACGPVAGLTGEFWVTLFSNCHDVRQEGIAQREWPDGQCLLEQEELAVEAFQTMRSETMKIMNEKRPKHGR